MPPRRSTRSNPAPAATAAADAGPSNAQPAAAPAKPARKATKRTAAAVAADDAEDKKEDDDEDMDVKQPAKKKSKVEKKSDDDEEEVDEVTKMVTVLKRGAAPVDPLSGYVSSHQVYADGSEVWDAMLNQSNIANNNNKFYVIQVLHPIGNSNSCTLYTRWGRVGERGQSKDQFVGNAISAVGAFKKQFKSKAGCAWESRHNMRAAAGKYTWIERSFEEHKPIEKKEDEEDLIIPDSKLDPALQVFCNMIFSSKLMEAALSSMNYDANKLPLGNLSKNTVLRGFAALKELAEVLETPTGPKAVSLGGVRRACETLSAQYYTIIPHAFGRNRPDSIDSKPKLKKELELVDALGDMEIAQKLIDTGHHKDKDGNLLNPLDGHFQSLDLKYMDPIGVDSSEHASLQTYVKNTHGFTHGSYQPKVLQAFRVERHEEAQRWDDAGYDKLQDGERLLLWHGSRATNFAGILKQGLRIAPPEAPVTGYMFGKGVYFADAMSKSFNYCYAGASNNIGIMLLCEVAARPFYEQYGANYNAQSECGNNKKLATKGLGRSQPSDWQDAGEELDHDGLKGCWMPKGALNNAADHQGYLQYNEYIVYSPAQIKLRYLLMVQQ